MKEPSLLELQRLFRSCIRASGKESKNRLGLFLNRQGPDPGEARLSVYEEGYRVRIRESLAETYESVRHLLGEGPFAEMAERYAGRYPSREYNLSFAGRSLPEFLKSDRLTEQFPFLPDLVRLEWAAAKAFHAFEEPPIDPKSVTSLSEEAWESARVLFQRSVALVESVWPILDLWEARKTPREAISIDLVNRPQTVLIFRRDFHVRCACVTKEEALLLTELLSGKVLTAALGEVAQGRDPSSIPVSDWFSKWLRDGLIVRVSFSG